MGIQETLQRFATLKIENTQIIGVVYENSKNIDHKAASVNFYRIVCHASYDEGSFVRTEVWLPDDWNGCLVGLGNGGMAGGIHPKRLLAQVLNGYASVLTDMGTSRGISSGIDNPAVWRDFGWRSTHEMTVLAKKLIRFHYGKDPDYSYFWGNSTGGQQAICLAQRFPEDYNGIIAGVHANNRVPLHTYFMWNNVHSLRSDGTPLFSVEEIEQLTAYGVEFFQKNNDGEPGDSFITYPWLGDSTIVDFLDFLKEKGFSNEQLSALKAIYSGPVHSETGKRIYCGLPIGAEKFGGIITSAEQAKINLYPFIWVLGDDLDFLSFKFGSDFQRVFDTLAPEMNANDPDLSAFYERGGKLIALSGSADPLVPFPDAIRYYESVINDMGGYDKVSDFYRYFIFPGKNHGSGGDGSNREWGDEKGETDLLCVLRKWHEQGEAPEYLYAGRVVENEIVFARKIYPYGSAENPTKEIMKNCEII